MWSHRIYGVHDEAKDKAFELEMSWVCDESNRQHQKVSSSSIVGYKGTVLTSLGFYTFSPDFVGSGFWFYIMMNDFSLWCFIDRYQMISWNRRKKLPKWHWRKWMRTKKWWGIFHVNPTYRLTGKSPNPRMSKCEKLVGQRTWIRLEDDKCWELFHSVYFTTKTVMLHYMYVNLYFWFLRFWTCFMQPGIWHPLFCTHRACVWWWF